MPLMCQMNLTRYITFSVSLIFADSVHYFSFHKLLIR